MTCSNKKSLNIFILIMLATISLFLVGCNEEEEIVINNQETQEVRDETIYLGMNKIRTLNPIASQDKDTFYIDRLIYESLFNIDKHYEIKSQIADSYDVDKANSKVEISIKNNIRWHNGGRLTADDVVFSFRAIKAFGKKGPYYDLTNVISDIKVKSINSVDIFFISGDNINLKALTFPIVRAKDFQDYNDMARSTDGFVPNGTGPYKYVSFKDQLKLKLAPFGFYRGKTAKSKILFGVEKKNIDRMKLAESSNISMCVSENIDRHTEISKKGIKIENFPSNEFVFLGFNTKSKSVENPNVRQAIATSLDVKSIITDIYFGSARKSESLFPPGFMKVNRSESAMEYNLDKAEKLLKKAKIKDYDKDSFLEDENQQDVMLNILVNGKHEDRVEIAELLIEDLETLGFNTNLEILSDKPYENAMKKGRYDVCIGGGTMDGLVDLRNMLGVDGILNYLKYDNPKLEKMLDEIYSGIDEEDMRRNVKKIAKELKKDMPFYCICYKTYGIVKSPVIRGEFFPTISDYYGGAYSWYSLYEVPIKEEK